MKFCVAMICSTALVITFSIEGSILIEHKIRADELRSAVEVMKLMPGFPKPQDNNIHV